MPQSTAGYSKTMELLVAYRQQPSTVLRNKLVRLNAGLVRKIAHRLIHQCAESFEDLEQIGYLGLIRAIERFDPKQGNAFSSFAVPYIRGEMLHYLRDRSGTIKIPRRWQDLQKTAQQAREALAQQLGRRPQDFEIAAELKISMAEWQEMKIATANRAPLSLDALISSYEDSSTTLGEILPDHYAQQLVRWEEDRAQLQEALNQLEAKTRTIIELVYLQNVSRKEAAERLGISPMTVTRRLKRGLEELGCLLKPSTCIQECMDPG